MSPDAKQDDQDDRHNKRRIKAVQRGIESARQRMHPGPFRIEEPLDLADISQSASTGQQGLPTAPLSKRRTEVDPKQLLQAIAAVATALWRARMKLEAESKVELPSELRHLPRHIQAAWDALAAGHIEVQDPKGQRYVPGMAVNPITFQPMEGIGTEIIHETLKPSVFYKDILIQRADVIVARPIEGHDKAASAGPTDTTSSDSEVVQTNSDDLEQQAHPEQ